MGKGLTPMQKKLLAQLPATRSELASALDIDETTVSHHKSKIDEKGIRFVRDERTGKLALAGHQDLVVDSGIPNPPILSAWQSIGLGLLLILCPVFFVWHAELLVSTAELTDSTLTFIVYKVPPLAVYHLLMYLTFIVNWVVGGWLVATAFSRSLESNE
jgi:hypothetical protein